MSAHLNATKPYLISPQTSVGLLLRAGSCIRQREKASPETRLADTHSRNMWHPSSKAGSVCAFIFAYNFLTLRPIGVSRLLVSRLGSESSSEAFMNALRALSRIVQQFGQPWFRSTYLHSAIYPDRDSLNNWDLPCRFYRYTTAPRRPR